MKIQLKRSNVLDGGAAKAPTAEQMEYGELALNYSATDPSIFIKNSSNNVIKIAGEGAITDEWNTSGNFLFPVNLNSSLLLGSSAPDTPTIRLNADGSATFGSDTIGYAVGTGTQIYSSQGIATVTASGSQGIQLYLTGVSTPGVSLQADGSATFTGTASFANDAFTVGASGQFKSSNTGGTGGYIWGNQTGGPTGLGLHISDSDTVSAAKISLGVDGSAAFAGIVTATGNPQFSISSSGNLGLVGSIILDNTGAFDGSNNKIYLSPTDGTATFAGNVIIGPNQSGSISNNQDGVQLKNYGFGLFLHDDTNNGAFITCSQTGETSDLFSVLGDGSALFAGNVRVNSPSNVGSVDLLRLGNANNSGSASAHLFLANGYFVSPSGTDGTGSAASILADGSASFAGKVTASNAELGTYTSVGRLSTYGPSSSAGSNTAFSVDIADDAGGSNQKQTVNIRQDGSATFAGLLTSNGDFFGSPIGNSVGVTLTGSESTSATAFRVMPGAFPSTESITFGWDGSAEFAGGVSSLNTISVTSSAAGNPIYQPVFQSFISGNGTPTIAFGSNGDATFAGKVTSATTISSDAGTTLATKDYVDANGGGDTTYSGANAWVHVASDGSLVNGLNTASSARTGAGLYTVTWATPMPNANYSVQVTPVYPSETVFSMIVEQTATYVKVRTCNNGASNRDTDFNLTVFATNALVPTGGTGTDSWGYVNGGSLQSGFNVNPDSAGNISNPLIGTYDITFTTPMPDSNYSVVASSGLEVTTDITNCTVASKTVNGFRIYINKVTDGAAVNQSFQFNVNATNAVLPQAFTEAQIQSILDVVAGGLGVGVSTQSWQNVTSSRATGTTYTNSTGNSIQVQVSPAASASMFGSFFVDGVEIASCQSTPSGGGVGWPFSVIVPNGSTYSVTNGGNYTVTKWFELRA